MLAETVREAAVRFGDRPAFVDAEGRPTTYAELDRRSDAVAAGLAARGLARDDVVALTLDSGVAWVVLAVACAKAGPATAGVNPRLAAAEQQACLDLAEPALVVEHADEVGALEAAGVDLSPPAPAADPERLAAVVFTSGTTGRPKGAVFRDRHIAAVARIDTGSAWGDPAAPPTPMLAATQMAHVGFTTKLAWYLRTGTTTHLLDRWRASDVLDLVERVGLPALGGVAPQIALLLRDPAFDQRDLSSVRALIVGGGPSPPALVEEARRRFGAGYSIRYSSTESGGVGTGTAFDAPDAEALHTVGRTRGGIEVAVHDDDGRPLPPGEVGEVWLRSDAATDGYLHDAEATTALRAPGGWIRTGDLGRIEPPDGTLGPDAAGCLVLTGRRSEMFIRGGYNVHPQEVEAVLGRHPGVAQVAVVARPDDVMGEVGVAVVVPHDPTRPPTLEELRGFAADELARHKLPEGLVVRDELPLTSMQKLDRAVLGREVATPGGA
ncbi:acyl--CoA ligase [Iamia sp. SCSIO 61187]|uniref:class I adenylate-forming enzyme family protein n=1 Tax=Iamia sp. SCSIO 61187 TaxID=2722752 RepID=UPI001C637597|nr:class I adenylate-forming enzyme family protein [Iamia sp. SCSIO 61187]QYG92556.1 acyl--CoA ligase [Iamia sp. SCSIO 61187]